MKTFMLETLGKIGELNRNPKCVRSTLPIGKEWNWNVSLQASITILDLITTVCSFQIEIYFFKYGWKWQSLASKKTLTWILTELLTSFSSVHIWIIILLCSGQFKQCYCCSLSMIVWEVEIDKRVLLVVGPWVTKLWVLLIVLWLLKFLTEILLLKIRFNK